MTEKRQQQKKRSLDQADLQAFHDWDASYDWEALADRLDIDLDLLEPNPEPKPEPKPKPEPVESAGRRVKPKAQSRAKAAPEHKAEPGAKTESGPKAAARPKTGQKPKPETRAEQKPAPKPNAQPGANAKRRAKAGVISAEAPAAEAEPKTQKRPERSARRKEAGQPRRRPGYYKKLLLAAVIMIALICCGTFVFWRYIEAYELSRHEHVIHFLRDNIDYDFWEASVAEEMASRLTEFETGGTVPIEPHLSKIRDVRYTFRQKSDENTPESPVYIIRAGARDIGVARLVPAGPAGFGFNLWEVGSIEFLDSFVDVMAGSVNIVASQNARVEINGVPVSQGFRVESEFEHGAAYLIEGIFGGVEVSVFEFDDRKSSPYFAENGHFIFPIINPFTRSFNILVPEGNDLLVDGNRAPAEFISEVGIIPEIFAGAIAASDVPLRLIRYEFELSGLYTEPVITAGAASADELIPFLSEDGEILFAEPFSDRLREEQSATVESFIRAYVSFGANTGNNVESNYANVSGRMLRGTDLHSRTQNAIGTMRWTSGVRVTYNSLEIDNFRQYGEGFFTCEARYNITHRTHYETTDVEGNFEILFVLSGGRWLAAKMVAIL